MCTVVLREIHRATECFNQTKKYLKKKLTIDIQSPQPVNGFGSFSINNTFKKNSALYTGEAAGLQDFFWGFGMRHAFTSGYLAAQSIINNKNYEQNAKNHFKNKLKASVVNRYLWENILYKKDYALFINNAELVKKNLYSIYNYNLLHKTIYPAALIHMKKKYNKKNENKATKH
jgi:flavin-dependent dehydrogenase